jgi:hypothetical protein
MHGARLKASSAPTSSRFATGLLFPDEDGRPKA